MFLGELLSSKALDFYQFKDSPFSNIPDPAGLFVSPSHQAALQAITSGIEARQGLVMLTSEAGLGKTAVVRAYLDTIDPQRLRTIYLAYRAQTPQDILEMLCEGLRHSCPTDNPAAMATHLNQILVQECKEGRNVALIIDDAHHLAVETFDHLCRFVKLDTTGGKLLQIVLVGQPALQQKLQQSAWYQRQQHLGLSVDLAPLTTDESIAYIKYKLGEARRQHKAVFTSGALKSIVRYAHGNPSSLNDVCNRALNVGAVLEQQPIWSSLVYNWVLVNERKTSKYRLLLWTAAGLAGLAAITALWLNASFSNLPVSYENQQVVSQRLPGLVDRPSRGSPADQALPASPPLPARLPERSPDASGNVGATVVPHSAILSQARVSPVSVPQVTVTEGGSAPPLPSTTSEEDACILAMLQGKQCTDKPAQAQPARPPLPQAQAPVR
jgi:general secretion pathway protein A